MKITRRKDMNPIEEFDPGDVVEGESGGIYIVVADSPYVTHQGILLFEASTGRLVTALEGEPHRFVDAELVIS